jgi:hypothetical protein
VHTQVKSIVGISTVIALKLVGSAHVNAQAAPATPQARYCQVFTPANLDKLTTHQRPNVYRRLMQYTKRVRTVKRPVPIAINSEPCKWNGPSAFHNLFNGKVSLALHHQFSVAGEIGNLMRVSVMEELLRARLHARGAASDWTRSLAPAVPAIASAYIDAHTKNQAAIALMEAIGFNATSSALNLWRLDNPTRSVLTCGTTTQD